MKRILGSLLLLILSTIAFAGNNDIYSKQVGENAELLKQQMEVLSSNLAALNKVYDGMLNAMNKN